MPHPSGPPADPGPFTHLRTLLALAQGHPGPTPGSRIVRDGSYLATENPRATRTVRLSIGFHALRDAAREMAIGGYAHRLAELSNDDIGQRPLVVGLLRRAVRIWQSCPEEFPADSQLRDDLVALLSRPAAGVTLRRVLDELACDPAPTTKPACRVSDEYRQLGRPDGKPLTVEVCQDEHLVTEKMLRAHPDAHRTRVKSGREYVYLWRVVLDIVEQQARREQATRIRRWKAPR